jgi:hypothetical protein
MKKLPDEKLLRKARKLSPSMPPPFGPPLNPRPIPMLRDTLGIAERAELARRAMAEPIRYRPPQPALEDFDGLAPARGIAWGVGITALVVALVGLVILLWP